MPDLQAMLFDGGNTVIQEIPGMDGPMVDWPVLKAVPGVKEALAALAGRYHIGMATNANQSNTAQIFAALRRVELESYFSSVYCARDMGLRKPEPAYFAAILKDLGLQPQQVLMVGDIYEIDVVGAKRAGLKAVWYNPEHHLVENNQPEQDAEIDSMNCLVEVVEQNLLPDIPTCRELLAAQGGDQRLWEHVSAVAGAAYYMAGLLCRRGKAVDPLLAHRGGLLHDFDKITSRLQNRVHGELAAEQLERMGYAQLGEIARRHLINTIQKPGDGPRTWEEKLVFYADKIVEGSQLVSLEERMDALQHRYPEYAGRITACRPMVERLQVEICDALGKSPGGLLSILR